MKYIFVADIDGDIDDIIAIEYLHRNDLLDCVVLDGQSRNDSLENYVSNLPARFSYEIPLDTKILFCGGALTKISKFIDDGGELDWLIMNGGFAGDNIVPADKQLTKFKGKTHVRTYNFNLDVVAARNVLSTNKIKNIVLVSKNVCHAQQNTTQDIHVHDKDWIEEKYKLSDTKRLHDLLMVKEGIAILDNKPVLLNYAFVSLQEVEPNIGQDLSYTKWGSILNSTSNIRISVWYK